MALVLMADNISCEGVNDSPETTESSEALVLMADNIGFEGVHGYPEITETIFTGHTSSWSSHIYYLELFSLR